MGAALAGNAFTEPLTPLPWKAKGCCYRHHRAVALGAVGRRSISTVGAVGLSALCGE